MGAVPEVVGVGLVVGAVPEVVGLLGGAVPEVVGLVGRVVPVVVGLVGGAVPEVAGLVEYWGYRGQVQILGVVHHSQNFL